MDNESRSSRKTLTKADLRESVYLAVPQLSRSYVRRIVTEVFEEIALSLEKGETIKLSRFGTFKVRRKSERPGRNPKTKESATITARRVVTFSASNYLRAIVNGNDAVDDDEELL